jgi:multidrug efflux system outer membrane protein
MQRRTFLLLASATSVGCAVGPNYRRPNVPVPAEFRAPEPLPPGEAASFANLKWFEVFEDAVLQELIRTALQQNYDLRDAAARVEEARASLGITRANQLPSLGAGASVDINRLSRGGATPLRPQLLPSQNRTFGTAAIELLSFEIDIWGRLRRETQAARANLLAASEVRNAVIITLVSDVAAAYFTLRHLDSMLEISQQTLRTRAQSLELTRSRQTGGVATLLDLRQAEQLVQSAAETIPDIQQRIGITENRIRLLLGEAPDAIARGRSLTDQTVPPQVPAGLPSALLERRPDIRAAEQDLIAANAIMGVARAAYFPRLTLSGILGGASTQLSSLFGADNVTWNLRPHVTQPIFAGGRLGSGVRFTEAQRERALIRYEKAIQTAFSEVSDALISRQRVQERREKQAALVATLEDRVRLAYVRYRGGVDTQLSALDADRDLFQAQLDLARTRLDELLSVVQLYKALGGGWL